VQVVALEKEKSKNIHFHMPLIKCE